MVFGHFLDPDPRIFVSWCYWTKARVCIQIGAVLSEQIHCIGAGSAFVFDFQVGRVYYIYLWMMRPLAVVILICWVPPALSLTESQKQAACHAQGHTESIWQIKNQTSLTRAFKSFPSMQQRAAFISNNKPVRGSLLSSESSLPLNASLGKVVKLLQHSQNRNGFCQMN